MYKVSNVIHKNRIGENIVSTGKNKTSIVSDTIVTGHLRIKSVNKKEQAFTCSHSLLHSLYYIYCGQTTAGQISPGHLGLPSVGQHWLEQLRISPAPEMFFNSSLESDFLFSNFFIL